MSRAQRGQGYLQRRCAPALKGKLWPEQRFFSERMWYAKYTLRQRQITKRVSARVVCKVHFTTSPLCKCTRQCQLCGKLTLAAPARTSPLFSTYLGLPTCKINAVSQNSNIICRLLKKTLFRRKSARRESSSEPGKKNAVSPANYAVLTANYAVLQF